MIVRVYLPVTGSWTPGQWISPTLQVTGQEAEHLEPLLPSTSRDNLERESFDQTIGRTILP